MRNGNQFQTKIGPDGRAEMERHNTDHGKPWAHTPHDHKIEWLDPPGHPDPQSPINYPGGAPEFKKYGECYTMSTVIPTNPPEANRFSSISDFKWSMKCGGEITFEWDQTMYGIFRLDDRYCISLATGENARWYDTLGDLLEHYLGGRRLRDIITDVTVYFRAT